MTIFKYEIIKTKFDLKGKKVKEWEIDDQIKKWMNQWGEQGWEIFQIARNDTIYLTEGYSGEPEETEHPTISDTMWGVRVFLEAYARRYR